jgi:hypothetical protein
MALSKYAHVFTKTIPKQCCQPWDFLRLLGFYLYFFSEIRPWDFSWDFSNQRVFEKSQFFCTEMVVNQYI